MRQNECTMRGIMLCSTKEGVQCSEPCAIPGYFNTIKEVSGVCDSEYLVGRPIVCNIHMTGATSTHDAIVWGPRSAQEENRRNDTPVTKNVEVTSELGCVTPYMVCPFVRLIIIMTIFSCRCAQGSGARRM